MVAEIAQDRASRASQRTEPITRGDGFLRRLRIGPTLFDPPPRRMSVEDVAAVILGEVFAGIPHSEELYDAEDWVLVHGIRPQTPEQVADHAARVEAYRLRDRMRQDVFTGTPKPAPEPDEVEDEALPGGLR